MMNIKRFEFNMLPVNCYVVSDETKETVLIDAGCYYQEEKEALKQYVEKNHLIIKHLICTHLHFDHIFGNPFVLHTFGIKAEANPADIQWLEQIKQRVQTFGIRDCDDPVPLGSALKDGDTVTFGNHSLKVLEVPGHSPGSLAFYCEAEKVVFTGDALFQGSIGRTDFGDGSEQQLVTAIQTKLMTLPDDTRVLSGHGPESTIGNERKYNIYIQ